MGKRENKHKQGQKKAKKSAQEVNFSIFWKGDKYHLRKGKREHMIFVYNPWIQHSYILKLNIMFSVFKPHRLVSSGIGSFH
jgi:hypothetical protein